VSETDAELRFLCDSADIQKRATPTNLDGTVALAAHLSGKRNQTDDPNLRHQIMWNE